MQKILGLALIMMCLSSTQAFGASDAIKVFAGFMNGVIHKDNLNYLMGCMNGTSAIVVDIENMVTHFSQSDLMNIGYGIMDVGKFLQDLPPACYYCDGIPEDFQKLGEFFSIFGNFTQLTSRVTYNLLWHYTEIKTDINEAMTEWNAEQYYDFGTDIGEALVLAVGDDSATKKILFE